MLYINSFIDFFQLTKKQIISTIITDAEVQASMIKLVDSQTQLAKDWNETTLKLSKALFDNLLSQKTDKKDLTD